MPKGHSSSEYMQCWRSRNHDKVQVSRIKWRNEHPKEWIALKRKRTPEEQRLQVKRSRKKVMIDIFQLLGNKCSNPFNFNHGDFLSDKRCLQIDHVHGKGAEERRKFKDPRGFYYHVRRELRKGSKEYQLLCANCNWIKRRMNKEEGA